MSLEGFETTEFTHDGKTRVVFRRGVGPGVVIMHEVPGIHPGVVEFARAVSAAGFTAVMPELFGTTGRPVSAPYALGQLARACISREFHVLAAHGSSPIAEWLRALCRSVHEEIGGRGIGAIGMCLTGNFALALMLDDCLMAPVLSQPSLPFPIGAARRTGLHVSATELEHVKERVRDGVCVLGLRFTADPMVPPGRFETLERELGSGFRSIEIDSSPGNPHGIPRTAHSVLAADLVDEEGHPTRQARDQVIAFFEERLKE